MWIPICSALVLVISLVDYYSGPDLTFSLFYFAVIVLYSWKRPVLREAVIGAFAISAVWLLADRFTAGAPATGVLVWNAGMRLVVLVGLAVIICRLRETLSREQSLARCDFLTGTLNARAFAERAALEISRARRHETPLTVAYADVDDFKAVNDRHGHSYGDVVLRTIAATLKSNLRQTDSISRVGGDEFVILLPETGHDQAQAVLSKLHSVLPASMQQFEPEISLSIGAVVFDEPPSEVDALIKISDAAMYDVKASGKNALSIHTYGKAAVSRKIA